MMVENPGIGRKRGKYFMKWVPLPKCKESGKCCRTKSLKNQTVESAQTQDIERRQLMSFWWALRCIQYTSVAMSAVYHPVIGTIPQHRPDQHHCHLLVREPQSKRWPKQDNQTPVSIRTENPSMIPSLRCQCPLSKSPRICCWPPKDIMLPNSNSLQFSQVNEMSVSGLMISPRSFLAIYTLLNMHTHYANMSSRFQIRRNVNFWKCQKCGNLGRARFWQIQLYEAWNYEGGRRAEEGEGISFIWHEPRLIIINCYYWYDWEWY